MKLSYVILYVQDIEASVAFYQKAFALKHKFTHESGDYAEMDTGATTLAFCSHELAKSVVNGQYMKATQDMPIGSQITFEPDDVKEAYQHALQAGAKSISAPVVKPWDFEVAMLQDVDGHMVELAKKLE